MENPTENKTDQSEMIEPFKKCKVCDAIWFSRDDMLADPEVHIIGYQAHFADLKLGLFLFNHSCNGTFAISAEEFIDMYTGPVFDKKLNNSAECPGYCRHQKSLEPCPLQCECAYIREIVQLLKKHPVVSHRAPGR